MMGATGYFGYSPRTTEQYRDIIQREELGDKFRIIDFAKRGNVCYAAVQHPTGYVFGAVFLTRKARDEFIIKGMDESSGPYYFDCPKRIIRKLSPLDELPGRTEYAKEWREKCLRGVS